MSKLQELIKELCPDGVEFKKLEEVCELSRGKVYSKTYINNNIGNYPVYSSQTANNGELGKISSYDYDGEYLTWTTDGAYAGTIFHRQGRFSITNVCGLITIKSNKLLVRFLYYWLSIKAKEYVYQGMGNPKLMTNQMEIIEIPLPPLEIQNEIVRILDTFTSHTAELQAELQARKEQYEYYRNKLLTFDENDERVKWMTLGDVCFYPRQRIPVSLLHKNNYVGVDNLLPNKQGKKESNCVPSEGSCLSYTINDILIGNIRPYLKKIWISNNNGYKIIIFIKWRNEWRCVNISYKGRVLKLCYA